MGIDSNGENRWASSSQYIIRYYYNSWHTEKCFLVWVCFLAKMFFGVSTSSKDFDQKFLQLSISEWNTHMGFNLCMFDTPQDSSGGGGGRKSKKTIGLIKLNTLVLLSVKNNHSIPAVLS